MIRDYLRAKVVKLLSRVILLVNGAIDAMYIMYNGAIEKRGSGGARYNGDESKPPPGVCFGFFFSSCSFY